MSESYVEIVRKGKGKPEVRRTRNLLRDSFQCPGCQRLAKLADRICLGDAMRSSAGNNCALSLASCVNQNCRHERRDLPGRQDQIGSIATGKNADLVVIKGDPATRISDIENVEMVFKDGVGYDSKTLIVSVREPYGQY